MVKRTSFFTLRSNFWRVSASERREKTWLLSSPHTETHSRRCRGNTWSCKKKNAVPCLPSRPLGRCVDKSEGSFFFFFSWQMSPSQFVYETGVEIREPDDHCLYSWRLNLNLLPLSGPTHPLKQQQPARPYQYDMLYISLCIHLLRFLITYAIFNTIVLP